MRKIDVKYFGYSQSMMNRLYHPFELKIIVNVVS